MVVATFKDGVTPEDIRALIPAEQAQAKALVEQGVLGFIKVAMPKRTVFLEALAKMMRVFYQLFNLSHFLLYGISKCFQLRHQRE